MSINNSIKIQIKSIQQTKNMGRTDNHFPLSQFSIKTFNNKRKNKPVLREDRVGHQYPEFASRTSSCA
jgi:hypothetical protein